VHVWRLESQSSLRSARHYDASAQGTIASRHSVAQVGNCSPQVTRLTTEQTYTLRPAYQPSFKWRMILCVHHVLQKLC
jgi:hypothetical protein